MKKLVQNVRKYVIMENWNHIDFVYGATARNMLFVEILRAIKLDTAKFIEGSQKPRALFKADVGVS